MKLSFSLNSLLKSFLVGDFSEVNDTEEPHYFDFTAIALPYYNRNSNISVMLEN